ERVSTTDTIVLENGEKIKLIGIKAVNKPRRENVDYDKYGFVIEPDNPTTTLEERALGFAKSLLEGKYVRLEFDEQRRSEDGKSLAYVYIDDLFINAEILKEGFADLSLAPPNLKYAELLRSAYREARSEK